MDSTRDKPVGMVPSFEPFFLISLTVSLLMTKVKNVIKFQISYFSKIQSFKSCYVKFLPRGFI